MSKVFGRTEKLEREFLRLTANRVRRWILLERLLKNAFDSMDIQQFETQCALAGMVKALRTVAFCQPQQLLSLS